MAARTTVITITHNGGLVIGGLLQSLPADLPLIVVDNASKDDTLDIVAKLRPDATVIRNSEGLGYGAAASQGLEAVETEFALLANPDSLMTADAVNALVSAADQYTDAAMFGPLHKDGNGNIEPSHDVELWKRGDFGKLAYHCVPEGPLCVEFLSGAVNLVRMDVMKQIGFYDPEIYLYYEDDDMCTRLRRAGHGLILVADSVVTHLNGGSVRPNRAYYWEKFWNIAWSRIYFERKYKGRLAGSCLGIKYATRFAGKALLYGLTFKRKKGWRDLARSAGSLAAVLGVRASKLPRAAKH
ncbi:glycosyltransferase family 2 protein [Thalassospira sp. HF15]|uniref:glycosyltransferase family 2 protein n=1 Tax=Thalassospira sp. HF15 TaxID=2722755 RepID=UPI0014310FB8|nr:glycosyltransferase family 2 protein [Thalassospira sp. HF15]NIY76043.1 glycosyltransferase family 2 protein [Thalassospira sp. HF15]